MNVQSLMIISLGNIMSSRRKFWHRFKSSVRIRYRRSKKNLTDSKHLFKSKLKNKNQHQATVDLESNKKYAASLTSSKIAQTMKSHKYALTTDQTLAKNKKQISLSPILRTLTKSTQIANQTQAVKKICLPKWKAIRKP